MGRIVIACYRPKPGKAEDLRALMKEHLSVLRSENLVTDRESVTMEAKDGTILEVFEWKSAEAVEAAHTNPTVAKMWERYADACEYVPLRWVAESADLFAMFDPFDA